MKSFDLQNDRNVAFFQAAFGGALIGASLSLGSWFFAPISIALLWSVIRIPFAGGVWGFFAVLISHRWLLFLHPLSWIGIKPFLSFPITICLWFFCGLIGFSLCWVWSLLSQIPFLQEARNGPFVGKLFYGISCSLIWGLGEVLLSKTSFFWIGISITQAFDDSHLIGLARWFGSGGVSTSILLLGWFVWQLFVRISSRSSWSKILILTVIFYLSIHSLGGFLLNKESISLDDEYKVALLQPSIGVRERFGNYSNIWFEQNLERYLNLANYMNSDFLVAPEGSMKLGQKLKSSPPIPLLTGGFRLENGKQRSSILVFNKNNSDYSYYLDKFRLVPLGEWMPSFSGFNFQGLSAIGGLERGSASRILDWNGPKLAGLICYEITDGVAVSKAVKEGAEWILAIANLDPYPLTLHKQFLALARLRSVETARDLVIVSNTGPSALVQQNGEIIEAIKPFQEGIGFVDLHLYLKETGYVKWGEIPLIIILLISFLYIYHSRLNN